jgi:hypothetical protein
VLQEVLQPTSEESQGGAAAAAQDAERPHGNERHGRHTHGRIEQVYAHQFKGPTPQYDSDVFRLEYRTPRALRIVNYAPQAETRSATRSVPVMKPQPDVVNERGKS